MRENEQQEKGQNAAGREQNEGRIAHRLTQPPAKQLGARALVGEHLEDMVESSRGFPDPHQRHIQRGESRGMMRHRVGEALATQYAGAKLADDRPQPSDVDVGSKQF